jgi:hypothetical protein
MQVRKTLPPMPPRVRRLHIDPERGFPVPWFVQWFDANDSRIRTEEGMGRPDYRVTDTRKLAAALNRKLCWVCGEPRGVFLAFNIGPMCAINRITSEPPSHRECATFAAMACPFLSNPEMKRRESNLPEGMKAAAGFHVDRNPKVALVWITQRFELFRAQAGQPGLLFKLGDPTELLWFAEGRTATRAEIMQSMESGFPLLHEAALHDGEEAVREVEECYARAVRELVPR